MPNSPRDVHASETRYDLDGFPIRTGSVAEIKPLIATDWPPPDGRVLEGWVAVGAIAEADVADLTAVIGAADIIILSRDPIDDVGLTVPAMQMAVCDERMVLLEIPDEPLPATVGEAIARYAARHK